MVSGDTATLARLPAEDAVLHSDGGGKRAAALNPIRGADKIIRFFAAIARKEAALVASETRPATINGLAGFVIREPDGSLDTRSPSRRATGASQRSTSPAIRTSCVTSDFETPATPSPSAQLCPPVCDAMADAVDAVATELLGVEVQRIHGPTRSRRTTGPARRLRSPFRPFPDFGHQFLGEQLHRPAHRPASWPGW